MSTTIKGINLKTLRDGLYDFIYSAIQSNGDEVSVIWRDQNAPQPDPPYITLKLISGPIQIGSIDDMQWDDDIGKFVVSGMRGFTLSVASYGSDSMDMLTRLQFALQMPENEESLDDIGIGINNELSILDLAEIRNVGFEQRSVMDIAFHSVFRIESTTQNIQKVEIEGEFLKEIGSIETSQEITS